jgi:hypothetical protein
MSIMDKIKSLFSGGSAASTDDHAGHDHSGHDHDHSHDEPAAAMPPADPAGDAGGEDRPA